MSCLKSSSHKYTKEIVSRHDNIPTNQGRLPSQVHPREVPISGLSPVRVMKIYKFHNIHLL